MLYIRDSNILLCTDNIAHSLIENHGVFVIQHAYVIGHVPDNVLYKRDLLINPAGSVDLDELLFADSGNLEEGVDSHVHHSRELLLHELE